MFTIRVNLVDANRPRLLPDRHAAKRSEYDRDDLAMIRDMDRELGPDPFEFWRKEILLLSDKQSYKETIS